MRISFTGGDMDSGKTIRDIILSEQDTLSSRVLEKIFREHPELQQRYSKADTERCREDIVYHLMYLADSAGADSPELFLHYLAWVKTLFDSIGVSNQSFLASLKIIREELRLLIPETESEKALAVIDRGIKAFPGMPTEMESAFQKDTPHYDFAVRYLDTLLEGDRNGAVRMVIDAVEAGMPVKEIYLYVFQPAQHELGRLWQLNKISVAQEHFCTAVTQLIMSQLYPYIFSSDKTETVFIGTCVGDELHEIGIRMLTDFLEMEGWDTYFLGANTPVSGVLDSIKSYKADIIGISATMIYHIHKVEELITEIRSRLPDTAPKILVGGYPFNRDPLLWKKVGADGYARDAGEALSEGEKLLSP